MALAALWLAVAPAAFSQAVTTSTLSGTVTRQDGTPVSGANVTAVYEQTGVVSQTTTRSDGSYAIRGLRPGGPYSLTVSATGLANYQSGNIFLGIDTGAGVNVLMESEQVIQMEKFDVTAGSMDGLFDPKRMGSGTSLNATDIANLPAGDRSINSLARLDPRISMNRDPFDRAISVSGISNRYNSIQVDGVSASDPFGLNANNTAAERNVIPLNSLEALTVDTSPDVRRSGFVGAQINAITKSGGNEFRGSAYYTYRGRTAFGGMRMAATHLDGSKYVISNFDEQTFGAELSGPIIPKKLFFSVNYEKVEETRVTPSPIRPVDPAVISQISAAATALGFKPGSSNPPSGNNLDDDNIIVKLDWQITDDHRATFRYNNSESSRPTFPGFGSGISENNFSFDSLWYQQIVNNKSYIGQVISRWSDRLNTEVSVSRSEYHSEPQNNSRQPAVEIRNVPVAGSSNTAFITLGTDNSRHANILDVKSTTAEVFAAYELNEKHTLEAGVQYDNNDLYNLFVQNAYGSYSFNSLQDFLNVAGNNNGSINYRTYAYNQIIPGVEPAAIFEEGNAGIFIKDVWRVSPGLRVDLGARVDMALLPDSIPYNATFANTFGVTNTATYDGKKIFQPRGGFNWDLNTKLRTVIRGNAGVYYGRMPRVWLSNSYSNTGLNYRTFSAGTNPLSGVSSSQAPIVSANPDSQPTLGGSPAMTVAFMDPSFELPSRYKANLAVERELGFLDMKATAEIEFTVVRKDVFYTNINLQPTGTGPDGREMYWNAYGATPSGTRLVSSAFTNRLIKLGNTGKGDTRTILFSLERAQKRKDGWFWRASYVNTEANEVLFGTSSVATSNWQNRAVFNANAQEKHTAELEVKDRVSVMVSKDIELLKGYKTTFSLFYEGRSGYPFSLVYSNDANGDAQTQNDLIYVPRRGGDPMVRFATTTDEANFFKIVDRFGLPEGKALEATSERYPWVNQFDFGIKQVVKLPGWRHRLVLGADILNIGNLLNDKWGIIRGSNQFFVKREQVAAASYDAVNNQYVYSNVSTQLASGADFNPSLGRGEPAASRWSVLLTAKYEF